MADPSSSNRQLNPALKQRTEHAHDTTTSSPAPVDSASVQREEGRAWPAIWLIATVISVMIALYLVFF